MTHTYNLASDHEAAETIRVAIDQYNSAIRTAGDIAETAGEALNRAFSSVAGTNIEFKCSENDESTGPRLFTLRLDNIHIKIDL